MKLLFDENLSYRLIATLDDLYPGSSHVREIGPLGSGDEHIWNHAAAHGFILVSKDTDFYQRSLVFGAPPRVIWLRVGNGPTRVTPTCSANNTSPFVVSATTPMRRSSSCPSPDVSPKPPRTRINAPPAVQRRMTPG